MHVQIELSVYKLLANYQTGGYKFRPMRLERNSRISISLSVYNALTKSTQA